MSEPIRPVFVRIAQAPAVFGLSRSTIYEMAKSGKFKIYKAGTASLLKVEEVTAAIEAA